MTQQLAYIAGIVDGEGCLMVGKYPQRTNSGKVGYRGFMGIANTNIPLLLYVKNIIGGKIVTQKRTNGPYAETICYSLSLTANEIRKWLPQLKDYLVAKKEQ